MRCRDFLVAVSLLTAVCFSISGQAKDKPDSAITGSSNSSPSASHSGNHETFSPQMRQDVKRQVMSRPGVFLDMSNLTDNGYVWSNDVVWEGEDLPANQKWYIAGFFFKRRGYKGVWLQYAFTLESATASGNDKTSDAESGKGDSGSVKSIQAGKIKNFKRWFGTAGFR